MLIYLLSRNMFCPARGLAQPISLLSFPTETNLDRRLAG